MRLFNCFEGDIATTLSEYDIKTIKACSTKDGIPMMMVNYKDSELCVNATLFCEQIELFNARDDNKIEVDRYILANIENTLRLCANTFNSYNKNTCLNRDIIADLNRVRKLLNGQEITSLERFEELVELKK